MILARLSQGLVDQLVSFGGIGEISEETAEVLGRHLEKPQVVSEGFVLLLQHPGLVLAVIKLIGGSVDQLLLLELLSVAC